MKNLETQLLNEIIENLKKLGYEVISTGKTWTYYTNGINVSYVQADRLRGFSFGTVNVPNRSNGTGYGADDKLTFEEAAKWALNTVKPSWEHSRHEVKKYTLNSFLKLK